MQARTCSWSELDCARQCEHKHRLAYKERWVSSSDKPALAKGSLWHEVMEAHYLSLKATQVGRGEKVLYTPDARLELAAKAAYEVLAANADSEHAELIRWMYDGYLQQWGIDEHWRIGQVEYATEVWLPTATGSRSMFKLKLKIDLIVIEDGHIWIVDHKSGKDLPKRKQLDINDQFALYTWAMRQLGHTIFGSLHNAARTHRNVSKPQPLPERFERNRLTRTDYELDTVAIEAYKKLRAVWRIPVGEEPRSPDEDRCGWRCDFTEPCLFGRKGNDELDMLKQLGFKQDFRRH